MILICVFSLIKRENSLQSTSGIAEGPGYTIPDSLSTTSTYSGIICFPRKFPLFSLDVLYYTREFDVVTSKFVILTEVEIYVNI